MKIELFYYNINVDRLILSLENFLLKGFLNTSIWNYK